MNKTVKGLVDADWLSHQLLTNDDLVILHTAMANPFSGEKPVIGQRVIPKARHFDFEEVFCDLNSDLPHTMPSVDDFAQRARHLGINNRSVIVIYDDTGIYCSPRVWWMFKTMGHGQVYVLDGGFPAWMARGFDYQTEFSGVVSPGDFDANYQPELMLDLATMLETSDKLKAQVIDARSSGRFEGVDPEPRQGVRQGHIPQSKNLPFDTLLNDGYMQAPNIVVELFEKLGVAVDHKLIFSCGSGVTACILALAAYQIGYKNISVYDGSWSEWGANIALPIALGKVGE